MKTFLSDDFLLDTDTAVDLYRSFAERQPIIDYHCHLPADQIADDRRFSTLTQLWLQADHYKWRAMRTDGVPERLITGEASDWEKFEAWAGVVPHTIRNPLYHWTHLELRFPFGLRDVLLGPSTARMIYDHCNLLLGRDQFSAQGLLRQFRVVAVCTTDDPADDLRSHRRHAASPVAYTRLYPTWRPDRALALQDVAAWNGWVTRLAAAADVDVKDLASFRDALERRHAFFHEQGCRLSDHGMERLCSEEVGDREATQLFSKARSGQQLTIDEQDKLRSALCFDMAQMDHRRGWTQQFHLGTMRNNNTRAMNRLGPNSGFDSIGDFPQAAALVRFLDRLDREERLSKTVLYNLNPSDNELFATVVGSFQDGVVPGKMQLGAAWWYLDHIDGMRRQLDALSSLGLLSRFVGMLSDSHSFLSFSRHDYFRRLLCNVIGGEVERGLLPSDYSLLRELISNVCFENARRYLQLPGCELVADHEEPTQSD